MIWFYFASLLPAVLLALACIWGGIFPGLSLFSITVFVFFMDKLAKRLPQSQTDGRALNLTLAGVHLALLPLGVWALSMGAHLSVLDKGLIFGAVGLFMGQISNSNAHELIHASDRFARRAGTLVYITLLHGHHVSAHLRVHHVHAATPNDPNSARAGEGFWAYCLRATSGEFVAGLNADTAHCARRAKPQRPFNHPYFAYIIGALISIALSFAIAGTNGILAHVAIAAYAQLQLLLSDYVQHYGLSRQLQPNGKPEPVGLQHSWNAPNWYSCAMMLNAPLHSDHHIHPSRAFLALEVDKSEMPMLPRSLPVMAVIALVPPLWRRVMDHRVAKWQNPI